MSNTLKGNIYYSLVEKGTVILFQLIASILMSRFLPREDFGIMGVVSGIFTMIQFLNISLETIMIRDFESTKENPNHLLAQIVTFNRLKAGFLVLIGLIAGVTYSVTSNNSSFLIATISYCFILCMDIVIAPFVTYSSLSLNQKLVSKITFCRWLVSVILLGGLYFYPSLLLILAKDFLVLLIVVILWKKASRSDLSVTLEKAKLNVAFIKKWFLDYSFWVHLISSSTNVIYRVDSLILFYFIPLKAVGNYNVALTAANMANIIPGILAYQNSIAVSRSKSTEDAFEVTGMFMRLAFYISVATIVGYLILGKFYLKLMTGNDYQDEIFLYLINIVLGVLIVKTLIAPLVAYINVKGDVKRLFLRVKLPILIITVSNYIIFAYCYGAKGVAISNVINGSIWALLVAIEIKKYSFKISYTIKFKQDFLYFSKIAKENQLLRRIISFK